MCGHTKGTRRRMRTAPRSPRRAAPRWRLIGHSRESRLNPRRFFLSVGMAYGDFVGRLLRFSSFRTFRLQPGLWEEQTEKETEAQQEKVCHKLTRRICKTREPVHLPRRFESTRSPFPSLQECKSILQGRLAFQSSDCFHLTVSDTFAKDHEDIESNVHRTQQSVSKKRNTWKG